MSILGFVWSSRAYYSESVSCQNEIMVVLIDEGIMGEFAIRFIFVGGKMCAHIEAFDDGWNALEKTLPVLMPYFNSSPSEETIINALKNAGFKDLTAYE